MHAFTYHQPTKIIFGNGSSRGIGQLVKTYGQTVLLVTTGASEPGLSSLYVRIKEDLQKAGLKVAHFDGVIPNPTIGVVSEGAAMARDVGADVIIGLGGGSSMDAAKAISVEATHEGSCWDYLFYKEQPQAEKLIPVIAVPTTAGTGSHVTQVAVVTHTDNKDKSALYNPLLFPGLAIVDPELTLTLPRFVTATTGFDVFCHAFESILHPACGAYVEMMGWEAISLVVENLRELLLEPGNLDRRQKMAWADTMAGLCIANAGVTLPHGIGMAIGGLYPHVAHGEALALVYPAFAEFTWSSAVKPFARVARMLNHDLLEVSEEKAAGESALEIRKFLKAINLDSNLADKGIPENEIELLASQSMVLPDYKSNPRVATLDEMVSLLSTIKG